VQNSNEVSGFIKGRKFTDHLSDWPLLKEDFIPLSWVIVIEVIGKVVS
jgi:hypothetical protein